MAKDKKSPEKGRAKADKAQRERAREDRLKEALRANLRRRKTGFRQPGPEKGS